VTAFREGHAVLAPDLSDPSHTRWPVFTKHALELGTKAVFVFPLQIGAIRLGLLYLHRDQPGDISPPQIADGLDLAEMAALTVLDLQHRAPPGGLGAGLEGDWAHHAIVHQATGLISVQLNTTIGDALARLRAHAFSEGRLIYDVANDVVAGRLRLRR
jgi:hypothetical protein